MPTLARIQVWHKFMWRRGGAAVAWPPLTVQRCPALAAIFGPFQMNSFIISWCQRATILHEL